MRRVRTFSTRGRRRWVSVAIGTPARITPLWALTQSFANNDMAIKHKRCGDKRLRLARAVAQRRHVEV